MFHLIPSNLMNVTALAARNENHAYLCCDSYLQTVSQKIPKNLTTDCTDDTDLH